MHLRWKICLKTYTTTTDLVVLNFLLTFKCVATHAGEGEKFGVAVTIVLCVAFELALSFKFVTTLIAFIDKSCVVFFAMS